MRKLQSQGVHHITLVGADRQTSIDFWEGVLGMPFVFEQPNLDNAGESHLYFDPGDGRLITVFTNEDRKPDPRRTADRSGLRAPHRVLVSQAVFHQAVERLDERGIPHSGVQGSRLHGLDLLRGSARACSIELASYRFEPPVGFTHSDVLLEAHKIRVERGDHNIDRGPPGRRDRAAGRRRSRRVALRRPIERPRTPTEKQEEVTWPTMKLHVLKPSVNNLTARIFVRAAELDFEEVDVWGKTRSPEFLAKNPAHLTPMIEDAGLPRATLWESCAIMQYLCNKHDLDAVLSDAIRHSGRWSTARCSTSSARSTRWSRAPPIRRSASRSIRARSAPPTPTTR